MKNDELHIITSILAGNTERFSYFLDTYGQQIFTLIVRMVGSPEDAEELTQDGVLGVPGASDALACWAAIYLLGGTPLARLNTREK